MRKTKNNKKCLKKIYILGAGGMAKEVLSYYKDLGKFNLVAGFIEEHCKRKGMKIEGKTIMDASIIDTLPKNSVFIGAIGSPKRKNWIEKIKKKGFYFDTLIYPSAVKGNSVKIGEGCIICPGVILSSNVEIGRHTIINLNASISHDCKIGNFVTICPGVSIGGNVVIGDECWIGIGATIIHRVSIGRGSYIGAGAVVVDDIPANVLAVGIPAKPIRKLKEIDWKRLI